MKPFLSLSIGLVLILSGLTHVASAQVTAPTIGGGLCSGYDATIECLIENAQALHSSNNPLFWEILDKSAKRARNCESVADVAGFMRIVDVPRDGLFDEYFHKKIENLCISNPNCFFAALARMRAGEQAGIVGILINPLFVDRSEITQTVYKYRDVKEYENIVETYLKGVGGEKRKAKN